MGKSFKDLKAGDYIYIVDACCARKEKIVNAGISENKVWIETDCILKTDCGDFNNYYHNIEGDGNRMRAQHEFSYELVFSDRDAAEEYIREHFVERIKD